jgi:hypothetical protein
MRNSSALGFFEQGNESKDIVKTFVLICWTIASCSGKSTLRLILKKK